MKPEQSHKTGILSIAIYFLVTAMFLACAASRGQESDALYMDDAAITSKVKTALFKEPSLKVSDISVQTYKGVVQLSGFVDSEENIQKAADITASIPGVVSVKNDLIVK